MFPMPPSLVAEEVLMKLVSLTYHQPWFEESMRFSDLKDTINYASINKRCNFSSRRLPGVSVDVSVHVDGAVSRLIRAQSAVNRAISEALSK